MKIVFFGTPDYVLPILNSLHKGFKGRTNKSPISAVVTQKPKPVGRKKVLTYSAVDKWAHQNKVPTFYDGQELVNENITANVGVLASYGKILRKSVINQFPQGIINIHFSLLPKYRGSSPVHAAILSGDKQIGVTFFKITEGLDEGPVISQFTENILPEDTTGSLRKRLFEKSATALTTLIPPYIEGKITPRGQDHKSATYTTLLKKSHGFIPPKYLSSTFKGLPFKGKWKIPFIKDYSLNPTPYTLERFIRAMQPWPIAWTHVVLRHAASPKRLKILKAHIEDEKLSFDEIQLEGKNPVSWKQFKEAYETVIFE
jgi:methionyl-tRNA formyltransferase